MANRLAEKVIVITGSTQGIGKGIAQLCAAEGAKVVINGIERDAGEQTLNELKTDFYCDALFIEKDLSHEEGCKELIEEAVSHFGRIDGLVNNAGIFPRASLLETTEELYDTIFNINSKGPFFCSKYAVAHMLQSGGGSIVHMGSLNAFSGAKDLAAYSSSKGALKTLNKNIAANYMRDQIRSNWITVGWVASEGEVELHGKHGLSEEDLKERAKQHVPSGRMQTPTDIGYGVIYLLSDESSQVTGTELSINGGMRV